MLFACNDDSGDSPTPMPIDCPQSEWVGMYTDTITCNGIEDQVKVTITTSGSNDIKIVHESTDRNTEYDALTLNGCELERSQTGTGFTVSLNASLNRDSLSIKEVITETASTSDCTIIATRN